MQSRNQRFHSWDIMVQRFFALLRGGLFGQAIDSSLFGGKVDWESIKQLAEEQAVLALVYDGITMLPKSLVPDYDILLEWFGYVAYIEQGNKRLNDGIAEVVGRYNAKGISPVLLKGQGIGQYYRKPLHRIAGDIDLYFPDGIEELNSIAAAWNGVNFLEETSHHKAFTWKDFVVENHRSFFNFYSSSNQRRWEEVKRLIPLTDTETLTLDCQSIPVPSPQMNALYIFLHLWHHCHQKGIGLRHVCDWVCLWSACEAKIDKDLFVKTSSMLPVIRPMTAVAWIAENYLGLDRNVIPLDTTTRQAQKDGEFLLDDILRMGNFGRATDMMKGFKRGKHLRNLRTYFLAFKRQMTLFRLCPSEIVAYPIEWFIRNVRKR
ncbi:MAG: nucleotidyltransferase family protein [Prevotella sp.]|nr:nucleotidyltransferase family protein [Prevotella sp.]